MKYWSKTPPTKEGLYWIRCNTHRGLRSAMATLTILGRDQVLSAAGLGNWYLREGEGPGFKCFLKDNVFGVDESLYFGDEITPPDPRLDTVREQSLVAKAFIRATNKKKK